MTPSKSPEENNVCECGHKYKNHRRTGCQNKVKGRLCSCLKFTKKSPSQNHKPEVLHRRNPLPTSGSPQGENHKPEDKLIAVSAPSGSPSGENHSQEVNNGLRAPFKLEVSGSPQGENYVHVENLDGTPFKSNGKLTLLGENHSQEQERSVGLATRGSAKLNPDTLNQAIIEKIKKEQFKEICEGYDISENELKAECIIDVEECIEKSCEKALTLQNQRFLEFFINLKRYNIKGNLGLREDKEGIFVFYSELKSELEKMK